MPEIEEGLLEIKAAARDPGSRAKIEVDGGVTDQNADKLVTAGADVLVAGSFVFRSENPEYTIKSLKLLNN